MGGHAHRVLSVLVFLGQLSELLLFLGAAALASSSLFRSTAGWLLLGREFALGDTPVSRLFGVTEWFLFEERFLPLDFIDFNTPS